MDYYKEPKNIDEAVSYVVSMILTRQIPAKRVADTGTLDDFDTESAMGRTQRVADYCPSLNPGTEYSRRI